VYTPQESNPDVKRASVPGVAARPSRALTTLTVHAMPTVTNTVTTTAADGSSTTVTKTETSDRFLLSPELAPDLEVGRCAPPTPLELMRPLRIVRPRFRLAPSHFRLAPSHFHPTSSPGRFVPRRCPAQR
jgi:hypothetical protein